MAKTPRKRAPDTRVSDTKTVPDLGHEPLSDKNRATQKLHLAIENSANRSRFAALSAIAISAHEQEAAICDELRQSAAQALASTRDLMSLAGGLSARIHSALSASLQAPEGGSLDGTEPMSAADALASLKAILQLQERANVLARDALELERLHLGDPSSVVNVVQNHIHMTLPELQARTEMAADALRRASASGGLEETPRREQALVGQRIKP